jgi:hypothetical protein
MWRDLLLVLVLLDRRSSSVAMISEAYPGKRSITDYSGPVPSGADEGDGLPLLAQDHTLLLHALGVCVAHLHGALEVAVSALLVNVLAIHGDVVSNENWHQGGVKKVDAQRGQVSLVDGSEVVPWFQMVKHKVGGQDLENSLQIMVVFDVEAGQMHVLKAQVFICAVLFHLLLVSFVSHYS